MLKPAQELTADDTMVFTSGETLKIDNVSVEHVEGGAKRRNPETDEMDVVFEFNGNEATVEFVNGEFATYWGTDLVEVADQPTVG